MPRRPLVLAVLVTVLAVTGCTSTTPALPSAPSAPVPAVAASGDGTLVIGTLFAMTGDDAASGAAQVAGTQLAVRDMLAEHADQNESVPAALVQSIQLIHRNSAGDLPAAYANLVARGADLVLWNVSTALPADAQTSLSTVAVVSLGDFLTDGAPLVATDDFVARLLTADPGLVGTVGGAEAYDAVITAALAATITGDDGAASLEAGWPQVTSGSAVCTSWGECVLAVAEGQTVDYQGITGRRS